MKLKNFHSSHAFLSCLALSIAFIGSDLLPIAGARMISRPAFQAPPRPVTWKQLINTGVTGASLKKTGGCDGCPDASAVAGQRISSDGGYVEFTAAETDAIRILGLDAAVAAKDLAFAIQLTEGGIAEVRESGSYKAETRYQTGDLFRISVEEGTVKFLKNGSTFYTSTNPVVYPLFVHARLLNIKATISNAVIAGESGEPEIEITGIAAQADSPTSVRISWKTSRPATTQVEYGTSAEYGRLTAENPTPTTDHEVAISRLNPATSYHFRVISSENPDRTASSDNQKFETPPATAAAPPVPSPSSGEKIAKRPAPAPPGKGITDQNVHAPPPAPRLPPAGETFVDPTFGTVILRLTDSTVAADNHNSYSYWPSFNSDSTRLWVTSDNAPYLYDFDPESMRSSNRRPLFRNAPPGVSPFTEDAIWSSIDPDSIFVHETMRLWSYNVARQTFTLIKNFRDVLPAGYIMQMSKSRDDKVFAFTLKDTNYRVTGYVAWDRGTDKIVHNALSALDEVQIDKTGRYLLIKTGRSGRGVVEGQVLNLTTGSIEDLLDNEPDYNPGHSDMGRGIVIGHDNWENRVLKRSLDSPHSFITVFRWPDWSQANHYSLLSDDEDWMLINNYPGGDIPPPGPFHSEILLVATDGSRKVRRLAHHQSIIRDYWDTPRANISRDGRFVIFTSNWGSKTQRDVFILKVP